MDKFYKETLSKLETAINELEIEADCLLPRIEAVIDLIVTQFFTDFCHVLKVGKISGRKRGNLNWPTTNISGDAM
jgi:hypothetical protein